MARLARFGLLVAFSAPALAGGALRAPVGSCISSPFGPRVLPGKPLAGTFHNGVDIPAPPGAAVRVVAAGTVVGIHRRGVGGLAVRVRHSPGLETYYAHLGRLTPALADGKRHLNAGEEIGVIGRSGLTFGTHLFFAMFVDGKAVDPEPYLKLPRCP